MIAVAPALGADEPDRGLLDERLTAQVGSFLLATRTRIGVDGTTGRLGTRVDLERDLGMRTGDRIRADLNWRVAGRHHLRAAYFDYGMEASHSISKEIVFRDTVYPVNASLTTGFGTEILELGYEYALVQRDSWDLLGTIGAHVLQFDFLVSGLASVGSQTLSLRTETASTQAPLPVVGIRFHWRVAPDWYLETQGQYFQASIDDYDGNIIDLRTAINWKFSRHFGVGAGYNYFRTRVNADLPLFSGSVNWRYSGAQFYLIGSF
jgi:hypothetical protein